MKTFRTFSILDHATVALTVAVFSAQSLTAGTENSWADAFGNGVMANNIVNRGRVSEAVSGFGSGPCSEVAYRPTTYCDGIEGSAYKGLPFRTPTSNYCRGQIFSDFVFFVEANVSSGITADNKLLTDKFSFKPAECSTIVANGISDFSDPDNPNSGNLIVETKATGASALGIVVYEYDGEIESREDLEQYGTKIAEVFLKAPFDFFTDPSDPCSQALIIPVTADDKDNIRITFDTYAASTPVEVEPLADISVACNDGFEFPTPLLYGACDDEYFARYSVMGTDGEWYEVSPSDLGLGTTTVRTEIGTKGMNAAGDLVFEPISFDPDPDGEPDDLVDYLEFTVSQSVDFIGFENPVGGTGGTAVDPIVTLKGKRDIPIKWALSCGGVPYVNSVEQHVVVYQVTSYDPATGVETLSLIDDLTSAFNTTSDTYHVNVDVNTLIAGETYKFVVEGLDDGIEPFFYGLSSGK